MITYYKKNRIKNYLLNILSHISQKTPKVLLTNYTFRDINWGCFATSENLISLIQEILPQCQIRTQDIIFEHRLAQDNFPQNFEHHHDWILNNLSQNLRRLKDIQWADLVILNGEGSIHQESDTAFKEQFLYRLMDLYAAKNIFNKKTALVNSSIYFYSNRYQKLLKSIYKSCDFFFTRERKSQNFLKSYIREQLPCIPDVVFLCSYNSNTLIQPETTPYAAILVHQHTPLTKTQIPVLLNTVQEHSNLPIKAIVLSTHEHDLFKSNLCHKDIYTIRHLESPQKLINMLGQAKFVLSERFHGCIFAAISKTPFLPFASDLWASYKLEGLIEMLDYPLPLFNYKQQPIKDIAQSFKLLQRQEKQIQKHLLKNIGPIQKNIYEAYESSIQKLFKAS